MQLSQNRFFQHKFYPNVVIKSSARKGLHTSTEENPKNIESYHLYLDLIEGERFIGMDGSNSFMLATCRHENNWTDMLDEWVKNNQYIDYNPFLLEHNDAAKLLSTCREDNMKQGQRLGQAIICQLGDKTPTPNINIWNSEDEDDILSWFYAGCVVQS